MDRFRRTRRHAKGYCCANLHDIIVTSLAQPDVTAKLAAMAYEPIGSTPAGCAEFFQSEMAKWGPVIKEAGLRAD